MAAAVESLLASINPHVLKRSALAPVISRVLKTVAGIVAPPVEVWRSTYDELTRLFTRLKEEGAEASTAVSVEGQAHLETLLFSPELPNEALRLRRTDVITAVSEYSPMLVAAMRTDILACLADERSTVVRDRLGRVPLAED